MASHEYISNTTNLFEDDDDDHPFINSYRPSQPRAAPAYSGHLGELQQQQQVKLERQHEIEQRILDSSARSIGLLRDAEQIGIATAKELVRQREELVLTNQMLDKINNDLTVNQKHLNGIKSMFYGLKNYFAGKSDQTSLKSQNSPESLSKSGPSTSRLQGTINDLSSNISPDDRFAAHPSTRLRDLDAQATITPINDSQRVNQMLDAHFDEIADAIGRLKNLGMNLGQEIEAQNELIDTIHDKVEGADLSINDQNKQMNNLLGK